MDFLENTLKIEDTKSIQIEKGSEYFTSISTSGLPTFLISVKNMNLLSSSIYKQI
jgi:hypothetical protein